MARKTTYSAGVMFPEKNWIGDFVLLPYGYAYNDCFLRAVPGDEIRFTDDTVCTIHSVQKVSIDNEVIQSLCLMRFGLPLSTIMLLWRDVAKYSGAGSKAVSDTECLFVCYGEEKGK